MNIVLASDTNYVQHCCATMTSILYNNEDVHFFLFTEGLSPENEALLHTQVSKYGGQLSICKIDSDIVRHFPMPKTQSSHISIATYYRLFVELVLPKDIDRVIYMDCDIIVKGSIEDLYSMEIGDAALAAVYQNNEWALGNGSFERLNIPQEYGYFNAGVLLINLKYWREHDVTERLFSFIREHYDQIRAHDQDTLNAVLYNEVLGISNKWNYLPIFLMSEEFSFPKTVNYSIPIDPIVIHFVYSPKPWDYYSAHPCTGEYFKYLDMTPFKGWKPKWSFQMMWKQKLKPTLGQLLRSLHG